MRSLSPFWKFNIFYTIYMALFITGIYTSQGEIETFYDGLHYFFYLFMLQIGLNVVSLFMGLIFQSRSKTNFLELVGLSVTTLILSTFAFSVWFPPLPFMNEYDSNNINHILYLVLPQTLAFFIGALVVYVWNKRKKSKKN